MGSDVAEPEPRGSVTLLVGLLIVGTVGLAVASW